jgi:hypothetical protein
LKTHFTLQAGKLPKAINIPTVLVTKTPLRRTTTLARWVDLQDVDQSISGPILKGGGRGRVRRLSRPLVLSNREGRRVDFLIFVGFRHFGVGFDGGAGAELVGSWRLQLLGLRASSVIMSQ